MLASENIPHASRRQRSRRGHRRATSAKADTTRTSSRRTDSRAHAQCDARVAFGLAPAPDRSSTLRLTERPSRSPLAKLTQQLVARHGAFACLTIHQQAQHFG